jgi:predicted  nucleic acid-binding Zn-ribbon protein
MIPNKYEKLETEVQKLWKTNNLTSDEIVRLFKKYEQSNSSQIKKLKKRRVNEHNRIKGALKQTINAHGPIDMELIGSATKRISGALITNENIIPKFNLNSFIWGVIIGSLIIILLV